MSVVEIAGVRVAVGEPDEHVDEVDVVLAPEELEPTRRRIERAPIAAAAGALLLRHAKGRSIDDGLLVESASYSTLQAGPEFAAWRAATPRHTREEPNEPVLLDRDESTLTITLNRVNVRNALNAAMRDAWLVGLDVAAYDETVRVVVRGNGRSYSSGGDLDEFGSFSDPASAHLVRLYASIGRRLAALGERIEVLMHGPCAGSGIELPAFAHRVVAHSATTFSLPELNLGLVPGAGGTWSLPQRIGRLRTAWMFFTGATIDASTALRWGLIDAIDDGRFSAEPGTWPQ